MHTVSPDSLIVKNITGRNQKAQLKGLQLLCLPADEPIQCHDKGCSIGLFAGRKLVAFGMAKRSAGWLHTLYLSRAGVHPEYRGLGLQKRLIQLREAWAVEKGMLWAITDTANFNATSMCSLITAGYRPFVPTDVKPWALRGSVYWRKRLTGSS